jgi:hypothetical protein
MKVFGPAGAATVLALLAGGARAETKSEFWPELDTWIRLSDATRLLFVAESTRDHDSGDRVNEDVQGYVDYRYSARISFRAGYEYANTPPATPDEGHSIEHRWVLDFNYNWKLGETTKLTNRLRTDLRDVAGETSYRIRDRLKLEHPMRLGRQAVTPYGDVEAFYDSQHDAVSRYKLEIGATTSLSKDIEVDLYAGRQRDTQPSNKYTNGLGITLTLYLR